MTAKPPAWATLAQAMAVRRPVRARYHGAERLLCPHLLGWKAGRAKTLCYQSGGATSRGELAEQPEERWRSLFVDDLETVELVEDGTWATAANYSPMTSCVDVAELFVTP
jgi:hypothetical protein